MKPVAVLTATRTVVARPQEQAGRLTLNVHEDFLCALIEAKDDIIFKEMRARLVDEPDFTICRVSCGASSTLVKSFT